MICRSAEASYVAIAGCSSRDWREMLNVALSRDVGTHGARIHCWFVRWFSPLWPEGHLTLQGKNTFVEKILVPLKVAILGCIAGHSPLSDTHHSRWNP